MTSPRDREEESLKHILVDPKHEWEHLFIQFTLGNNFNSKEVIFLPKLKIGWCRPLFVGVSNLIINEMIWSKQRPCQKFDSDLGINRSLVFDFMIEFDYHFQHWWCCTKILIKTSNRFHSGSQWIFWHGLYFDISF